MVKIRIDTQQVHGTGQRLHGISHEVQQTGHELRHAIDSLDTRAWDGLSRMRAEPLLSQASPSAERLAEDLSVLANKLIRAADVFEERDANAVGGNLIDIIVAYLHDMRHRIRWPGWKPFWPWPFPPPWDWWRPFPWPPRYWPLLPLLPILPIRPPWFRPPWFDLLPRPTWPLPIPPRLLPVFPGPKRPLPLPIPLPILIPPLKPKPPAPSPTPTPEPEPAPTPTPPSPSPQPAPAPPTQVGTEVLEINPEAPIHDCVAFVKGNRSVPSGFNDKEFYSGRYKGQSGTLANGTEYGQEPQLGAVMVESPNSQAQINYGHASYVCEVTRDASGKVTAYKIAEGGWADKSKVHYDEFHWDDAAQGYVSSSGKRNPDMFVY